jgi:hypothetical protein
MSKEWTSTPQANEDPTYFLLTGKPSLRYTIFSDVYGELKEDSLILQHDAFRLRMQAMISSISMHQAGNKSEEHRI